ADQTRIQTAGRHRARHRPSQGTSPHGPQLPCARQRRRHQRRARRRRLQLPPPPRMAEAFVAQNPDCVQPNQLAQIRLKSGSSRPTNLAAETPRKSSIWPPSGHILISKLSGEFARKRGARMALNLRDVRCDLIANRALNELMHYYTVAQEKSRLVLTKKTGDMKLFLNDLDDLHQLDFVRNQQMVKEIER